MRRCQLWQRPVAMLLAERAAARPDETSRRRRTRRTERDENGRQSEYLGLHEFISLSMFGRRDGSSAAFPRLEGAADLSVNCECCGLTFKST
jgi:hypothetical protein